MRAHKFSAFTALALAALGAAGCSKTDGAADRAPACVRMDDSIALARSIDAEVRDMHLAQADYSSQAFTHIGGYFMAGRSDGTMLIMDADTMRAIQIGTGTKHIELPDGTTRDISYPLFAAFNRTQATTGRMANGQPSYGLVAAPMNSDMIVEHTGLGGTTGETVTVLTEYALDATSFAGLPADLQRIGAYQVRQYAENGRVVETLGSLSSLHERTENQTVSLFATASQLRRGVEVERARYPDVASACDAEIAETGTGRANPARSTGAATDPS